MGYAAFEVIRSTGGKRVVFFPKVTQPLKLSNKQYPYLTLSQLLEIPDFPIEANVITRGDGVTWAQHRGLRETIINFDDYVGETWTLNNGSTMYFMPPRYTGDATLELKNPSGADIPNATFATTVFSDQASLTWLPSIITDPVDGQKVAGYSTAATMYGGKADTFRFGANAYFPHGWSVSINSFFEGAEPIYTTDDPYGDGGTTEPGGGTGSFDGTGDNISIPGLPTLSAVDAGFITLFNPTLGQMHSLASYMWSDLFDINGWKKIFADPMGAILGLSIVPVAVPDGGVKEVTVGNISTGVSMTIAASQYVEVDCGTLNVNEFWGAYLDYDPYTKAELYLPYIGIHPVSTDDIMNKPVHVVYHVDILSGACCAYVQCGGSVLYSFIGQCASSIPITGDNWTNVINGAISIAGSIGSMVATGGASAPMAIGQIASTAVNTMKPTVEKSGAMGGTGGMLGVQTPYLILTRPRQALPRDQNAFIGYPSFITEKLGDLSGYTEIDSIHLENVPATEPELSEIESLLKGGVIF